MTEVEVDADVYLVKCEPLMEGDDHGGQGFCGQIYNPEEQWSRCPHNVIDGPGSDAPVPPLAPPMAYRYRAADLSIVHITTVPRNLEEALDYFTNVAAWCVPGSKPVYIERKANDASETEYHLLPFRYNAEEDEWDDA